jgi:hypothetical protein
MTRENWLTLVGIGALLVTGVACGGRFQAGLANAPNEKRNQPARRNHDAITNGDEGNPPKP